MSGNGTEAPLCHCGRPAHHTGLHKGQRINRVGSKSQLSFAATIRAEIASWKVESARLTAQIERLTAARDIAEARLPALHEVLARYELWTPSPSGAGNKAAPKPTAAPKPPPTPAPTRAPWLSAPKAAAKPVPASLPDESLSADDFEPIEAEFQDVARWARERAVGFVSWDDLPAVNRCREDHELPTFKKRLGTARRALSGAP